jgi:hypothetical protein
VDPAVVPVGLVQGVPVNLGHHLVLVVEVQVAVGARHEAAPAGKRSYQELVHLALSTR